MFLIVCACIFSSILLATIGCLTVWNRYVYLSDGIIHIMLIAALLNLLCGYPLVLCSSIVSVIFVVVAQFLQRYFSDYNLVLNVTTTAFIALGIIVADYFDVSLDIEGLFFGDILFVTEFEVIALFFLTSAVCFLLYKNFNTIVISALNEEIAISYGANIRRLKFVILLMAALSISLVIKVLGGLTITSLSIVPVFFARIISKTPKQMLLSSIVFSLVLSLIGLDFAFRLDYSVAATTTLLQISVLFLTFGLKKYIL